MQSFGGAAVAFWTISIETVVAHCSNIRLTCLCSGTVWRTRLLSWSMPEEPLCWCGSRPPLCQL